MKYVLAVTMTLLTGCMGTLPTDPHGLSADVVKAMAADNKGNVACATFLTPWGKGRVMQILVDTGTVKNGGIKVGGDCESVEFTTNQSPPKVTTTVTTVTAPP